MRVYVLLGQSDSGDDDGLGSIGCRVFSTLEAAKAAAAENDDDDDDAAHVIEWDDGEDVSTAHPPTGEYLEIRAVEVDDLKETKSTDIADLPLEKYAAEMSNLRGIPFDLA